ncbi:putative cholesterol oxidase protein [Zalerion maritima]|uniref:Cholesterol oxidase n=1 Tax=Zalerion maritima TaxID=339359 RepID=A0AAD5RV80_9PEZI|nr:putative cholesterol oxidase protein [Zalerion maritima]
MPPTVAIDSPEMTSSDYVNSTTAVNSFLLPAQKETGLPSPSPSAASDDSQEVDTTTKTFRRHQSHPIPTEVAHGQEAEGPQDRAHARIRTWGDDWESRRFPRLSKPVEVMRHSYDVVVIGSGYGGGVAASRMARAGKHVCLLERGKERWPGEYPVSSADAVKQLHVSGEFSPGWLPGVPVDGGDPTGMYHLILGKGQNAVVGNGLGGTSLMNANVFLEADHDSLAMKMWPKEIRNNPDELRKYYQRASDVLEPETYPPDWPKLPKLDLLEQQAEALGMKDKFKRAPQTTRFRNGPNSMGVEMKPSALTGQDCTGVNDGSKNTTLVTYVADAWNWGAEMFCECEVRYVEKAVGRDGWIIYYAWHGQNRAHFKANLHGDLMWVHAKEAVFLGAGTLGTTEILLRSRDMGLTMSNEVGQNMSGNGDILAFGYNTDHEVNSMGRPFPSPYSPVGPCITGVIDNRHGHDNPLDGYVIEEGTMPTALAPFLQAMLDLLPGSIDPKGENVVQRTQAALQRYGSRFLGPYYKDGAMEKTQVYLIMSHDSNQAILTLKDDKPVLEFMGVGRSHHVKELNAVLEKATNAIGGTFVQNPFYALLQQQQVTVHPIGGAAMARDGTGATGATNDVGEVFSGNGPETYDGLVVMDGALVPTALGVNPFATITALAERAVEKYCDKKRLNINWAKNGLLNLFDEPRRAPDWNQTLTSHAWCNGMSEDQRRLHEKEIERFKVEDKKIQYVTSLIDSANRGQKAGFGFTEVMSGFLHHEHGIVRDEKELYELAFRTAKNMCESARFFLSVQSFDTRALVREPDHSALLTGTFVCPTIPGSPFMVHRGQFNLFLMDTKAPGTRNLTYDFDMTGVDGNMVHFHGYKVVDSSVALAPVAFWKATSTLYVTVTKISDEDVPENDDDKSEDGSVGERRRRHHEKWCNCGEPWRHEDVLAKGMMTIKPTDFASEILTMTPTGSSIFKKIWSATSFLTYFTRKSMSLFLAPFTPLQYPSTTYTGYINDTPPTASYAIVAQDEITTRMHMWEPTYRPKDKDGKEVEVKNLFMIPGAAVDHQIYALPTIQYNAINYFRRAGYRCFVSVHRIGQLVVAQNHHTTYDARLDLRADLEYIREHFGKDKVYTIAHCMGSVAFSTGLLDGTIPADWILGVSCSQVFMNPIWNAGNMLKIKLGVIPADVLYKKLAGDWFSCSTSPDDTFVQRALNEVMRILPDERAELCNNASCHRCTLVFGRCWNHRNLNEATHRQIDRFFGGVNVTLLHLLMKQGYEGHVMSNEPAAEALDTEENVRRLEGVPFLLFVGGDNAVLSPESTQRTYEILCDAFGRSTEGQHGVLQYRRRVVPGYGHLDCWMGRNAWKDVYPFVREEVDRVVRGELFKFVEPDDVFKQMVESGAVLY